MKTRVVNRTPEWRFQAEVIARLHKMEAAGMPLTCAGDMNRGKRSRAAQLEAKLTGMTAGEADVRVYLSGGRLLQFELKTPDGSRTKAQKARHARLGELGFEIVTIAAPTPTAMANEIERLVLPHLGFASDAVRLPAAPKSVGESRVISRAG